MNENIERTDPQVHFPPIGGWGDARKCGPTALSVLTGRQTQETARAIRALRDCPSCVNGTSADEMIGIITDPDIVKGLSVEVIFDPNEREGRCDMSEWEKEEWRRKRALRTKYGGCPTFSQWYEDAGKPKGVFLVGCSNHWIIMKDGVIYDRAWCGKQSSHERWQEWEKKCDRIRKKHNAKPGELPLSYFPKLEKARPKPLPFEADGVKRKGRVDFVARIWKTEPAAV